MGTRGTTLTFVNAVSLGLSVCSFVEMWHHYNLPLSLHQITALCRRLDELWEENQGNVVLFTWMQFLKEETLEFLGIQSPLEIQSTESESGQKHAVDVSAEKSKAQDLDPRAVQEVDSGTDILTQLLDFDEAQKQKVFDGKVFCCGICYSEKLGSDSLLFKECQHVYCKACMKEYFEIQIRDGKVQCLNCPEPKCMSMATPTQVSSPCSCQVQLPLFI